MKTILLNNGKLAYCDDIDFEYLNSWTWSWDGKYVQSRTKGQMVRMHELVFERMTGRKAKMVDHVDELTTNNMRDNLRESNKSLNGLNRKAKGFTQIPSGGYRAQLSIRGVRILDKVFRTQQEAEQAYNKAKYDYLNTVGNPA